MTEHELTQKISQAVTEAVNANRLTLKEALVLIARAEEKAAAIQVPMVITVVNDGGNLIAKHCMDHVLLASIEISQSKAFTSAALRITTEEAAKSIQPGQSLYGLQNTHPGRFCLFAGGIPIYKNGQFVGAIGVSGGTADQDNDVAKYAVHTF